MNSKKIIVDILLFILIIIEYSRLYINPTVHEIIGIGLIILIILHIYLNRNYFKSIKKGKYNFKRSFKLVINITFLIVFILTCIFGIFSSQFLSIGSLTTIYLHKIFAYLSVIHLGLHLSFNINPLIAKIPYKKVIFPILIIFGIYSLIQVDFWNHLTGRYGFSMLSGNITINSIYYIGIVLMIIVLLNLDKLTQKN
jgi:hypothetical protein